MQSLYTPTPIFSRNLTAITMSYKLDLAYILLVQLGPYFIVNFIDNNTFTSILRFSLATTQIWPINTETNKFPNSLSKSTVQNVNPYSGTRDICRVRPTLSEHYFRRHRT